MSRAQDTVALLRGLQIIAKAASRSQDEYLRHLWANSSVRELLEAKTRDCKQKLTQNPTKELENVYANLKESFDRSATVVESLRQYAVTTIDSGTVQSRPSTESNVPPKAASAGAVDELDVASITLKELETLLSERSRKRSSRSSQEMPTIEKEDRPQKPILNSKSFMKDEKYVEEWMTFMAKHDPKKPPTEEDVKQPAPPIERSQIKLPELSSVAKQRKVPSSRIGRMASFGTLFAGLGIGTINELTKGALGLGGSSNVKQALFSENNAERIVDTLCKVRGAALKIGQILSIQDSAIVSPEIIKAFDRVRQAADYMPDWQVEKVMKTELGDGWRDGLRRFEDKPFAAASIGQVHRAEMLDGTEIAIKIQYPGVAQSIVSDIDNLVGMLKVWDIFPAGIFIDNVVKVAKRELAWEVDYIREAEYTEKFGEMIAKHKEYRVPKVIRQFTTKSVITTELVPGVPLDKCFNLSYEHRKFIGEAVLKLCLRELFEMRCMQTDPNWSNFLYDPDTMTLMLIDFGSTRFYTDDFMDDYRRIIVAAVHNDYNLVLEISRKMGFLTGYETKQMETAHVNAVMILGELFRHKGEFDFGKQDTTKQIASLVPTMIAHRLCPPPEEIYSIHRKLSGVFLLCSKLNIKLDCHPIYEEIIKI